MSFNVMEWGDFIYAVFAHGGKEVNLGVHLIKKLRSLRVVQHHRANEPPLEAKALAVVRNSLKRESFAAAKRKD